MEIILVKEVSATSFMERKRRNREEWYLFSISSLLNIAKKYNYSVAKLYLSKFIPIPVAFCKIAACVKLFEFSPTFTIIFKANEY